MSLRTRLFLWVGGLFFIAFLVSVALESYFTDRDLLRATKALRDQYLQENLSKRDQIETFLAAVLSQIESQVDAELQRMVDYSLVRENFSPISTSPQSGTWLSTANFLLLNKWVDFIQNTKDELLNAVIVPHPAAMDLASKIPISEDLAWVTMHDGAAQPTPYMGVRFHVVSRGQRTATTQATTLEYPEYDPEIYILFSWQALVNFSKHWQSDAFRRDYFVSPFLSMTRNENFEVLFNEFSDALAKAILYIPQGTVSEDQMSEWIRKDAEEKKVLLAANPPVTQPLCIVNKQHAVESDLRMLLNRDDEDVMIWSVVSLFATGSFGGTLFDKHASIGAAHFNVGDTNGLGFLNAEVFCEAQVFDAANYFKKNPPNPPCAKIAGSTAVIHSPSMNRIFLGNVARFGSESSPDKENYLTIGVGAERTVRELSLAVQQVGITVHMGRVIDAFSDKGEMIDVHLFDAAPMQKMLTQKAGFLTFDGEQYYFLHMQPFKDVDLHFFIFNLAKKEFGTLYNLNDQTKWVLKNISMMMHFVALGLVVIVLLILHDIARKITQPITILAKAAEKVGRGELQDIELPAASFRHQDEIQSLCVSFEGMVKGLIEKEKVKGVLNKVVSAEIAQEILKGNIHLGGEEKVVTVFFADIRGFTHITQNMKPEHVIEMLNKCMTKVSNIIDAHGGVIDKYVGDEVMALFGAPLEHPDSPLKAVLAAVEMVDVMRTWNVERSAAGFAPIELGIGIHMGPVIAGNMGAENRLNYTVLGSNVNLAARLCAAAGRMQILISKETWEAPGVQDKVAARALPPLTLKGFDQPVPVYEVTGVKTDV